jgi:arylsulfatase A-like enzyme
MKNLGVTILLFLGILVFDYDLQAARRQPNIIIFFADDMGYGDLGCFGNPNIRTPNIDKLAEEGIKLTSFYVAGPVCSPSRAGLMTGRYPLHTLSGNLGPGSVGGLNLDEPIIAEVLKDAGYRSIAIGKWHLGHTPAVHLPTGRGFDQFYGLPYSNDMIRPWVNSDEPLKLYVDDKPVKTVNYDQDRLTIDYTEVAVEFIEENKDRPFFIYLPYSMPHLPISTTDKFLGTSVGGLYGDVIETIDWSVGEVVRTLEMFGIKENTLIIFSSDNGPWLELPDRMLQRGVEPWHQGTAGLLHGSKASTYEGGMRVPGIICWDAELPAGQVSSEIVSTLDIFPTLIQVAAAAMPEGKIFDGYNLIPFLKGIEPSPRKEFFYFRGKTLEAVRSGDWKLRYSNARRPGVGPDDPVAPELYNLKDDPGERFNMGDRFPDTVRILMDRLRQKAEEVGAGLYP